jgi:hypothetical protein
MTRGRATARLRYLATKDKDRRLFQTFHKGEHRMSKDLRSTAEVNQKVIVALSGLTEKRLEDCALEVQLNLETFDTGYGKEIEEVLSPEEFFEAFAAHKKWGRDFSSFDDSSLVDLDKAGVYLAAAWNFNRLAKYFHSSQCREHGWAEEEARPLTLSYLKAVDYLIGRALTLRTGRTLGLKGSSWAQA